MAWHKAITWASVYPDLCHRMALLGHIESTIGSLEFDIIPPTYVGSPNTWWHHQMEIFSGITLLALLATIEKPVIWEVIALIMTSL